MTRLAWLARAVLRAPGFHLKHVPLFAWYRLKHMVVPKGEFVSVSGPDGSGKTTVLQFAAIELERLFGTSARTNAGHFRPSVLPRIAAIAFRAGVVAEVDDNYASPHRGRPSGLTGSFLRWAYYLTDYVVGYWVKIRPAIVRRELVLYDRYYFDMVADPGRSRISLPRWMRTGALAFVPLPHSSIFVRAPPSIVHMRKQELSLERIRELNDSYMRLVSSGRLQLLENVSTVEVAAAELVDTIIARRRKRLKLRRE